MSRLITAMTLANSHVWYIPIPTILRWMYIYYHSIEVEPLCLSTFYIVRYTQKILMFINGHVLCNTMLVDPKGVKLRSFPYNINLIYKLLNHNIDMLVHILDSANMIWISSPSGTGGCLSEWRYSSCLRSWPCYSLRYVRNNVLPNYPMTTYVGLSLI